MASLSEEVRDSKVGVIEMKIQTSYRYELKNRQDKFRYQRPRWNILRPWSYEETVDR